MDIGKQRLISRYCLDHPESAAQVLMKSRLSGVIKILNKVPISHVIQCLNLFPASMLAEVLDKVSEAQLIQLLELLLPNKAASSLRLLIQGNSNNEGRFDKIFSRVKKEQVHLLEKLLAFPDQSVGSIMNPVPFSVGENFIIKDLLALLRKKEDRYSRFIYVVGADDYLLGVLPFKNCFYAEKESLVSALMTANPVSLRAELDSKRARANIHWKKWDSLPVTDSKNRLLGVIRFDALDQLFSGSESPEPKNLEILRAGSAVGEILQIAVIGTASAFGIDEGH